MGQLHHSPRLAYLGEQHEVVFFSGLGVAVVEVESRVSTLGPTLALLLSVVVQSGLDRREMENCFPFVGRWGNSS